MHTHAKTGRKEAARMKPAVPNGLICGDGEHINAQHGPQKTGVEVENGQGNESKMGPTSSTSTLRLQGDGRKNGDENETMETDGNGVAGCCTPH